MKKNLVITAILLLSFAAAAFAQAPKQEGQQQRNPEEMIQKRAEGMASKLLLSDADAAKFIPVYKEYLTAQKAINEKYRNPRPKDENGKAIPQTDKDVEAGLRAQFAKSQEILDLRVAYFEKYLKVLSPRQIRELYKQEQEQMQQKFARHAQPKPAPQGAQAQ